MGDHEGRAQPNGLLPNGLLPHEAPSVTRVLDTVRWLKAEQKTAELIACIQPNQPSEEHRNAVANYVQRLITKCFSCQVFTFGSVPLKTYLPDGDIDLTAISEDETLKDTWADKVRDVLENEMRNENAEFHVKEVQYIQAEVKIVKCLVENIVVDISFNQVGGLCTLCFLEEVDHLINQNHLFKRSIILIKAWCYYESRILGAHHGLISTYALETLVLYIFHVFNNSFTGPLEVLYRFLQFFSNFDWDKFCVSLWGPVPTGSLPDMTAEPPRKDSGELLLSKLFLHACSTVYSVFPGGQESQGQSFVSKHFNVIDPLRTNNNLGRSVSKGKFFRILSAFSFGAKSLAKLLECPKENFIAEVNQFFMNTWERHGSGHRPDAPSPNLWHARPLKTVPLDESNNTMHPASIKKKSENGGLQASHEHQAEGGLTFQGSSSQVHNSINQHSQNAYRTSNSSMASRSQSQRSTSIRVNSGDSDQFGRNTSSSVTVQADRSQKSFPSNYSANDHDGQGRFQFARTQSSPELTKTSAEVLSRATRKTVLETGKKQIAPARSDYGNRRNNSGSDISGGNSAKSSFDDPSSLRHSSSHHSLEAGADSNSVSNSYHVDTGFATTEEEFASVSEAFGMQQEMHQEEQDLVNMMASSRVHNFNGPVQFPIHLASPHLPLPPSPALSSMGYSQRNLAGTVPNNLSLMEPFWGSSMQFTHGFVSSPPSHYFSNAGLNSYPDDKAESVNGISEMTEVSPEGSDRGIWHEHDAGSTRGFDPDSEGFQTLHTDDKQQSSAGMFDFIPSQRGSNSGISATRSQHKLARENNRLAREDYTHAVRYQTSRGNDMNSNDRNSNLRFFPVRQASSSRSKPSDGSSMDGLLTKVSKSVRDNWGTRPSSSAAPTSLYGKAKGGWQFESSSDNVSSQEEDDSSDWVSLSTISSDMAERTTGSASLPSPHTKSRQFSGYELAQISGPDSMMATAPMLVGSSRPRMVDNSGVVPFAFYATGPPVPFLTMLPVYNFPSDRGNSDGSKSQLDRDERDHSLTTASEQNSDSTESIDQSEAPKTSITEPFDEHKADILNGDFASHWQNLQYGRFCQIPRNQGSLSYPSPAVVPPVYLQGHFSWDGPGRPLPSSLNFPQIMGYGPRLVPVMPLQPGPNRPSGLLQHYGNGTPRYRGGTGTYLPNPKVSLRDRQFSSTRNHRGSYSYDQNEHSDREGSWISSKARAAGRSNGRNQAEKSNSRVDRSVATENRTDRLRNSYRREPVASHEAQNSSFGSSNSSHSSANTAYSMYPVPAVSSNGVNQTGHAVPPAVMLYPYDQGVGYDSPAEPPEFGSLGPVRISGTNEAPPPSDGNPVRGVYEPRHGAYQGGSLRTSPNQPSSPRFPRSTIQRNYRLKDEDFPPLPFPDQQEGGGGSNYNNRPHQTSSFFNPPHS